MRKVVLVVDDSIELRAAVETLLRQEGYEVVCAGDGARGLALLAMLKRPAVAVVDYEMPAMDGADMVAHVKRDPSVSDIPIVMLSGHSSVAKLRGIFAFVPKPFAGSDLLAAVNDAFDAVAARR